MCLHQSDKREGDGGRGGLCVYVASNTALLHVACMLFCKYQTCYTSYMHVVCTCYDIIMYAYHVT